MNTPDFVPDWAKGIVWYQIFPERFWNGDPSNDPTVEDQTGSWPHDPNPPWQVQPWTSDWYELQPYEGANGRSIWHNLQRRRYGGDLQGIIDRLDYLQELGVGALYLNPVFIAPSSHKYDGAAYHHVDPTFGPDPDGDRALMAGENPANIRQWEVYCQWSSVEKNPSYDTRKPTAEERRLHKLAVLFQMTYPGAPMVYYGDEAGMWGANDPCCRKPMVWPDLSYASEASRPDGTLADTPEPLVFDQTWFDLYRGLIHLRNNTPALRRGDFAAVLVDDEHEVYAFRRSYEGQTVLVAINRSTQTQQVMLPVGVTAQCQDLLNGGEQLAVENGAITVEIPPLLGRILLAG